MTNFACLWLMVAMVTVVHTHSGAFQLDSDCGINIGCFSDCDGGCSYQVTWKDNGAAGVDFTMKYKLESSANQWIAMGLSTDNNMRSDYVTECAMEGSSGVAVYKSYNNDNFKFNERNPDPKLGIASESGSVTDNMLTCQFTLQTAGLTGGSNKLENLANDYVMFFASGLMASDLASKRKHSKTPLQSPDGVMVDLQGTQNIGGTTMNLLVKVHGCLMIAAWVLFASIGVVLARYYKPIWPERKILKEKVWFQFHRGLMVLALFCVIAGFVLIFVHAEGWTDIQGPEVSNFQKAHPYLGVIVTALTLINPIMALFRPHPGDKYRFVFNWAHWIVGTSGHILGVITIFIGVTLELSSTPFYVVYILAAYAAYQFFIELVLEIHDCCLGGSKSRSSAYEMQDANKLQHEDQPTDPEGSKFKKIVIALHTVIILGFASAVIIIVAIN